MITDDFLESLRQDFLLEAEDYLAQMQEVLLRLEAGLPESESPEDVEVIYRTTHSLKGAARSVNLPLIEQLCISLEDIWKQLRSRTLRLNKGMFDVFNQAVDLLQHLVDDVRQGTAQFGPYQVESMRKMVEGLRQQKPTPLSLLNNDLELMAGPTDQAAEATVNPDFSDTKALTETLETAQASHNAPTEIIGKIPRKTAGETIRVPVARLEQLMSEMEELLALHNSIDYFERLTESIAAEAKSVQRKLDELQPQLQLDVVNSLNAHLGNLSRQLARFGHTELQHKTSVLQQLQHLLMFPMAEVFDVLPRMVRDIAQSRSKQVSLIVDGAETGVDRRIIEGIKDPIIHLVRNCIDHGIETPEIRKAAGKPVSGTLKVAANINGEGKLQLIISDDGAGIDTFRLREKAVAMNLMSSEKAHAMDEAEAIKLIFVSGLSTSTNVSDISGHGLGMSIVAEKIQALTGTIDVESDSGKGTTFIITLPRVLSLFRGILVREYDYNLLIPIQAVVKAMRLHRTEIGQMGAMPVVGFRNDNIPLVHLGDILKLPDKPALRGSHDRYNIIVVQSGNRTLALQVGQVIGEESGVVRPFEPGMGQSDFFAGALLLSSGQLAFVLRTDIFVEQTMTPAPGLSKGSARQLLVVEDSLTVRNLLRHMLETAGYLVTTANDGLEALKKLESESFDAVISDIEMPRMNGFELTKKIRMQQRWKFLPVVLVTSLESEDDKRKGMESGASAYVTKRDFEKGNLLQILGNLLV